MGVMGLLTKGGEVVQSGVEQGDRIHDSSVEMAYEA
jgi:hypothetical protein